MSTKHEAKADLDTRPWTGPTRHYDILKEGAIALVIVTVLTVGLAALFSSPDDAQLTFKGWAQSSPDTMYTAAVSELAGSSESAGYGPPYNNNSDGLSVGPIALQKWAGVTHPFDAAQDLVIAPLESQQQPADVAAALATWKAATADQQAAWAEAYDTALADAEGDAAKAAEGDYGPVPALATGLVAMGASGAYDGAILSRGSFFTTDYTKQLLFMGDGGYMEDKAVAANLGGDTWGMMNEAGSWPGQSWLAFASVWYQLPMFNTEGNVLTDNADAIIFFILVVLCLIMILVPFIPGLRSLPRWIPLHRLVWKQYYKANGRA